jgi:hypothetical protein
MGFPNCSLWACVFASPSFSMKGEMAFITYASHVSRASLLLSSLRCPLASSMSLPISHVHLRSVYSFPLFRVFLFLCVCGGEKRFLPTPSPPPFPPVSSTLTCTQHHVQKQTRKQKAGRFRCHHHHHVCEEQTNIMKQRSSARTKKKNGNTRTVASPHPLTPRIACLLPCFLVRVPPVTHPPFSSFHPTRIGFQQSFPSLPSLSLSSLLFAETT